MLAASRLYWCWVVIFGFQVIANEDVFSAEVGSSEKIESASKNIRSISETVRHALTGHPLLGSLRLEQDIKSLELQEIKADWLPQIKLLAGIGREDSNNSTTRAQAGFGSDEYERKESSLYLRQNLFDGYENRYQQEAKRHELEYHSLLIKAEAEQIALDAAIAHLDVIKAKRLLDHNIENLKAHELIARNVGIRARSGKDDRAKVNQISARLSLALANVETAKRNLNIANSAYEVLAGDIQGFIVKHKPGLLPMPETKEALLEMVTQNHPLILSAKQRASSFKSEMKAAKAYKLPDIYLEAGASWNSNVDGVPGRNDDAYLMLRLDFELYDGGARYARTQKVASQIKQAELSEEEGVRFLKQESDKAWFEYQSNTRRVSLVQDYVEAALGTKSAYVKQFEIGQRSLIDMLDAENELLNAKSLLAEASMALQVSKYRILQLQGKLIDVVLSD